MKNKKQETKFTDKPNKKILIVANVGKEHINKFHIPTIKALKANGWTVDVACSGEEIVPFCDRQIVGKWKRTPFTIDTIKGIIQLQKVIKNENYNIIYCHTPVGGLIARTAANSFNSRNTKIVYCAHGLHFYKGAPLLNWLLYFPIEKYLSRKTDVFITVNKEDFDLVSKFFNKKMKVLNIPGIGVDFSRLKVANPELVRKEYRDAFNLSENTIVLIYVAELNANKNQKMLIEALAEIKKKYNNVYLFLIGPNNNNSEYQNYAKSLGISEHVSFLGWRSDIGPLLYMSDICVASSIREGFGINIVEAMYCGLPVIATNNRGHRSIITHGENGYLVDIDDYKTMSKYIDILINNPEIRDTLSDVDVTKYDCDLIATQLVKLFEEQI